MPQVVGITGVFRRAMGMGKERKRIDFWMDVWPIFLVAAMAAAATLSIYVVLQALA